MLQDRVRIGRRLNRRGRLKPERSRTPLRSSAKLCSSAPTAAQRPPNSHLPTRPAHQRPQGRNPRGDQGASLSSSSRVRPVRARVRNYPKSAWRLAGARPAASPSRSRAAWPLFPSLSAWPKKLKVTYGRDIGCKIRFRDQTAPETCIKVMTDGILLAETQGDPDLLEYDTIIVDEAHERSLNIDFLLGYLRLLRRKRPDLKIVITSATIDTETFSRAFRRRPGHRGFGSDVPGRGPLLAARRDSAGPRRLHVFGCDRQRGGGNFAHVAGGRPVGFSAVRARYPRNPRAARRAQAARR